MTPDALLDLGDRVIAAALPGEQVEAVVVWSRDTEVRAYNGAVEQFTSASSAGVGVRVVEAGRVGFAHCGTFDESAVREALDAARDNQRFATPDGWAGLVEPDGVDVVDLDLFDARLGEVTTAEKVALAIELERLTRAADDRIVGLDGGADYGDSESHAVVVSTSGVRSLTSETAAMLSVYTLASDGGELTTGFGFGVARSLEDLAAGVVARDAAERAVRLLGAGRAPSARMTVVLDPWVTAQLIGIVGEMFSADAVLKGRTPFAERIGELVASPLVTLVDDPTDPRAWGATRSDGEGLACRPTTLIDAGRAAGFLYDGYTARALGARSTGSAVRAGHRSTPGPGVQAVSLRPGSKSRDEILAGLGDAFLVQEVSGLHSGVNAVSGDFSTGAEGFMIRGGAPAEPIREVTIASTLQRMLGDVVDVGGDVTHLPLDATGVTLAIADVTVSGE